MRKKLSPLAIFILILVISLISCNSNLTNVRITDEIAVRGMQTYSEKGGYKIKQNNENAFLQFYDYNTNQLIYLCNKPNCNHDTKECSAFLHEDFSLNVLYYKGKLYYVERDDKNNASYIMVANEQGQERKKLYYNKNEKINIMTFISDDKIYYEESIMEYSNNNGRRLGRSVGYRFCSIDINGKNKKVLFEQKGNMYLYGVYKQKLLLKEYQSDSGKILIYDLQEQKLSNLKNFDSQFANQKVTAADLNKSDLLFSTNLNEIYSYNLESETFSLVMKDATLSTVVTEDIILIKKQNVWYYYNLATKKEYKKTEVMEKINPAAEGVVLEMGLLTTLPKDQNGKEDIFEGQYVIEPDKFADFLEGKAQFKPYNVKQ